MSSLPFVWRKIKEAKQIKPEHFELVRKASVKELNYGLPFRTLLSDLMENKQHELAYVAIEKGALWPENKILFGTPYIIERIQQALIRRDLEYNRRKAAFVGIGTWQEQELAEYLGMSVEKWFPQGLFNVHICTTCV